MNEELKKKLYDTGFNNECTYGGCSQGVLGSVKDNLTMLQTKHSLPQQLLLPVLLPAETLAVPAQVLFLPSVLSLAEIMQTSVHRKVPKTKTEQLQSAENSLQSLTKNKVPANVQKYSRRFTASHTECIYRKKKPNLLPAADTALTAAQK